MTFSIGDFRQSFTRRGEPQRTNQFQVFVFPPLAVSGLAVAGGGIGSLLRGNNVSKKNLLGVLEDFRFRCMSANFPGKNIQSFPYQQVVGPPIQIALGSNYDEFHMEVIMSQSGVERQLMAAWIDYVQPVQLINMDVRYFDTYTGSILTQLYDAEGKVSNLVSLINCFPTNLGSVDFSWSDTDRIATFRCSFAYERMETIAPTSLPEGAADLVPLPDYSLTDLFRDGAEVIGNAINKIPSSISF